MEQIRRKAAPVIEVSMKSLQLLLLSLGLTSGGVALAGNTEAGLGGALGGAVGAMVGQQVGGNTGAAVGAGLGGAAGSMVGADRRSRTEAAIGGALGAAGGNVIGQQVGGNTGGVVGAAVGGGAGGALGNHMGNASYDDARRDKHRHYHGKKHKNCLLYTSRCV